MSDVAAYTMRGFMRAQASGAFGLGFWVSAEPAWSEGAVRLYELRRATAARVVLSALALDFAKVCVVDGLFVARPASDPLPGFDLRSGAALDLYTAQTTLLAHELAALD